MGMPGRKRGMVLGFLGFASATETTAAAKGGDEGVTNGAARRVRPSDDDDERRRWWYAERDIDRRASEFIDRVHRGMLAGDGDDDGPSRR
ncbi:hypothetical protein ACP4OV_015925 [Aristida adscensionis]